MILEIPLSPKSAQTFSVRLGEYDVLMSLYWRQERLYADIDVAGQALCRGAICEHDADIVGSPSPVFTGSLRFFDTRGTDAPRWDGLGERWILAWSDEVDEHGDNVFG
jgi:hypothetical protein